VDFAHGQKTGFYLDQRENRRIVQGYSEGRRVMNLFAYTGGFALYAARGGARSVVSVESSRQAVEMAKINVSLNTDLDPGSFQWLQQDVFSLTPHAGGFEMVIVDPPPFARRRSEVEGAIRGYLNVNRYALGLLEPGGYAVSFSCSGAVGRESFRHILTEAALRSGRKVRFLKELHADCDHVVAAEHPEGEYLKGWLIHAE
jgi:23S rRNA (cytosine1962-C5)-methyltransferase